MLSLLYHIKLYKNHMNESLFIKLRNHLTWNKFQSIKVKKNDVMMPKNGHFILQALIGILGQLDTFN